MMLKLVALMFAAVARAQAPTDILSQLSDPSILARLPAPCVTAGTPLLTTCQAEIAAVQAEDPSVAASLTPEQIADQIRANGISEGCCGTIGALIDANCVCDPNVQNFASQLNAGTALQGLAIALPDVCGRPGVTC